MSKYSVAGSLNVLQCTDITSSLKPGVMMSIDCHTQPAMVARSLLGLQHLEKLDLCFLLRKKSSSQQVGNLKRTALNFGETLLLLSLLFGTD